MSALPAVTTSKYRAFLQQQDVHFDFRTIFITAMGAMVHGLFASLLIGTIMRTLGQHVPGLGFLVEFGDYAVAVTGAAMAVAIGYALKAPPFVLCSLLAVGAAANALGGAGGPLAVFFIALIALYAGKLVSKTTPVDIIVTPFVTVLVGVLAAKLLAPPIGAAASAVGTFIMWATDLHPLVMGIVVATVMGFVISGPISSAALAAAFGLTGLAGAAALAGCAAHMVGFAVASWRENKGGGLLSQGIGTSMLQLPNLTRKPILWLPAVAAAAVAGPVATAVFRLQQNGPPIASGMGTSGLVGPIGMVTGWFSPSEQAMLAGATPIQPGPMQWVGLAITLVIIPAAVALVVSEIMRKRGIILPGDLKIDD